MNDNKILIKELLNSIKRKGIEELVSYLESNDFFEAPASTRYHLDIPGGLVKHSLNVYYNLKKMCGDIYDEDTIKIVSLLHDICKANMYKKSTKNIQNEEGKWILKQTYIVDDILPLGHGEKSVIIIQKYINLTVEEMLAIRWHMGSFESKENQRYLNKAFADCKLAVWLHMADLKATYIDENQEGK